MPQRPTRATVTRTIPLASGTEAGWRFRCRDDNVRNSIGIMAKECVLYRWLLEPATRTERSDRETFLNSFGWVEIAVERLVLQIMSRIMGNDGWAPGIDVDVENRTFWRTPSIAFEDAVEDL